MKMYKEEDLELYSKGPKKNKEINANQKVMLMCDNCGDTFFRIYAKTQGDFHFCKTCAVRHSNRNRDPNIHKKMIQKSSEVCKGKPLEEKVGESRAAEIRKILSKNNSGKNNPNYGGMHHRGFASNPIRGSLEENFGKEKALLIRKKRSENAKGKNNPMYGKPAPQGSGNGWQGWYKGIYFSSLLELSFMCYCEKNDIRFEPLSQTKSSGIKYVIDGKDRTYFPDFIINEETLVEVKPHKLVKTALNSAKIEAAKRVHFEKFVVMTEKDIEILGVDDIREMYYNGDIRFIHRYDVKFKENYL